MGTFRTRYDGRYAIVYELPCQHCTLHVERMGYSSGDRTLDYNGANSLWFSFALQHQATQHKRSK